MRGRDAQHAALLAGCVVAEIGLVVWVTVIGSHRQVLHSVIS